MPQAVAGESKDNSYFYAVEASLDQVQDFYDREMLKIGWKPFASGVGKTGGRMLLYKKADALTTLVITLQGKLVMVIIVQT